MTVGYGDITAVTVSELWFSAFSMLLGCGVFAYIISSIGSIVYEMRREKAAVTSRIYEVDRFLHENKIARDVQSKVKAYMRFMYEDQYNKKRSQRRILAEMPKGLRKDIMVDLNVNILNSNPVFSKNFGDEFRKELCLHLEERIASPGDVIDTGMNEKNGNSYFYFIKKGKIELSLINTHRPIKTLLHDKYFGDITFFSDKEPKIIAKSTTYSKIYCLSKRSFLKVLVDCPDELESYCLIRDKINLYNDYSNLRIKCFACKSRDHFISECPVLNITLKSDEIIALARDKDLSFRSSFVRKGKRHHFRVFEPIVKKGYQLMSQVHSLNDIDDLENTKEAEGQAHIGSSVYKTRDTVKGTWMSNSLVHTETDLARKEFCSCQHPINQKPIEHNREGLDSFGQNQYLESRTNDARNSEDKEIFYFDRVRCFKKYFPHNNIDNILNCNEMKKDKQKERAKNNTSKVLKKLGS